MNVSAADQPKSKISEPRFGEYLVGDDYFLANYTQLLQYWEKLTKESDRIQLVAFGSTPEGRPMKLAIITSAENHKHLKRYQEISVRLAKAEGLTDEEAKALAIEGKTVVWIDGGLHATETVNSSALFTTAYDLLSRDDAETLRILDNVILLLVPANPDGMDLVADWYMKESDPKKRNMAIPRLYQKYVGHDNNRDSYIANQLETEAINRQMYIEWIPQIMYNQHQTGPAGTVLFFPPFRDPFNYNHDPLVPIGIDLVGSAVHNRFLAEGKGGAVMRDAAPYSTWFNGGDRTTVGFHNQIGLMHEIIGSPTPISIPLLPSKLLPNGEQPLPIGPRQEWHQSQSIEYVISADRAILDIAAKMREDFLYRIYVMGKNSIERGSQDYWTLTPKRITELETAYAKAKKEEQKKDSSDAQTALSGNYFGRGIPSKFLDDLKTPETRDPRGYIIPSDQVDFLTATKFVNALLKAGVDVHRATKSFQVAGKTYPAGSYVVKAAQAFRPHLRDMFEPQDHPNDLQYPGGPPKPPYDLAGYTLAFQMGVQFDRILDGFEGPFEKISGLLTPPAGKIQGSGNAGYLLSHQVNDAFVGTTRLLAGGEEIYWLTAPLKANNKTYPEGTIYIPAKSSTRAHLQKLADELGLNFDAVSSKPQGDALKIRPVKVALWDRYGGSMDSGWIRWLLEQAFPFPFDVIYPQALDAGNLKKKYDVIIFPGGAIPAFGIDASGFGRGGRGDNNNNVVPDEYKDRTGNVTAEKTIPQLRKFAEEGGVLLAIGSSTDLGYHLGLPLVNALTEIDSEGAVKRLPREKFFVPGSVLRVKVDNTNPVAYGIPEDLDLMYSNNPAFRLLPEAKLKGVNSVAWFPNAEPLRSGWAWGQFYLNGGSAVVEAPVGKGKVFLFAPEITFRGQPHASFKFLFNSIYYAGATAAQLK
ncbi:peptidase [Bacteroidia bacterium]|nr:peptidase [Bacteroidia bacterium]